VARPCLGYIVNPRVLTAKKGLAFGSKRSVCMDIPAERKALPGRPLAPAISPIRGSRR
jgi:hypothetical protein